MMYQDFFGKNDDYLDEFRQKVAKQKIASMEERRTELARSRNNFLGTFAGIALAAIVGWFVLAPQYTETAKEVPLIRRPQSAIKIKPENPGGMDIPNQDKDVYNIVEKKEVDNTVVENLLPPPEQPKLPDIVPEVSDIDENAENLDEIVDEVEEQSQTDDTQTALNETDDNKAVVPEKPSDLLVSDEEQKSQAVAEVKEEVKAETEIVASENKTVADGNWQIQFIASKNKEAVEKLWLTLSAKYGELKNYSHEVQKTDLGAQGIFYRLRAGAFASKEEAQKACNALKAKGLTDCIAKER